MRFLSYAVWSLVVLLALGGTQASATITNGDFSSGLTGWSTTGVVTTATSYTYGGAGGGTILPTAGTQVAELVNAGGVADTSMDTFLGLKRNTLQKFSDSLTHPGYADYSLTTGSVLKRTLTGASGILSFDWNFWRTDYPPYNDLAFFTISGPGISGTQIVLLSDVNGSAEALATTSGYGPSNGTGWQSYSYALPSTGNYTIGFGIVNASDTAYPTYLYIDNVSLVPEPSAAFTAAALLGTGMLYPLRRRRRA
ncbi:MAG: hypothetical protein KDN22_04500 [Verrucomicrobiae bacterium]|nr:hypothetical protein [Verrucomicrobiae bacterium]